AGRVPLPARADLLAIFRRGHGTVRPVGWWLDDARAAAALPTLGILGTGLRAHGSAAAVAVVSALALWKMARREPGSRLAILALPLNPARSARRPASETPRSGTQGASRFHANQDAPWPLPHNHRLRVGSAASRRDASAEPYSSAFSYQ